MELHFDEPDTFATGAIGPKGQRVFFLMARQGGEEAPVKLEKQQVARLADYLEQLLSMLPPSEDSDDDLYEDPEDPGEPADMLWTVGGLEIGYSEQRDRIALYIEELAENPDEDNPQANQDTPLERIRVLLRRGQTIAFIRQAREIIAAGRPLCMFCADPLNYEDTWCPCHN